MIADGTLIAINRGRDSGVDVGWRGQVLDPDGRDVPDGDFVVMKVTPGRSIARVRLGLDTIRANKHVRLSP